MPSSTLIFHAALVAVLAVGCGGKVVNVDQAKTQTESGGATEATVSTRLGDVIAVEVEAGEEDRRFTRDPAAVTAVLQALGADDTWTPGGLPRCRPILWARLVPPSGEGGATFQFCGPDEVGYLYVPDAGAFALDEAHSRGLLALVGGLELPEVGSIPPVVVTEHLDGLVVVVGVVPGPDAPQGLRTLTLARGVRLEPDAVWPDGTPVGLSIELADAQAARVVGALALSGFFHRGARFHSPMTDAAGDPPVGSTEGAPPAPAAPGGWVSVTVSDGAWHRTWHEASGAAIFQHSLGMLRKADLGEPAAAALLTLSQTLP